jgi:hypothetical protein
MRKRNEAKRNFFWNRNLKPKRNKYFSETKRNETKKKIKFIDFVVVPPPVDTIFDFRAGYRSENLPLKYEQLVMFPLGPHLRITAVEQDWADQGIVNGEFCLA